MAPGTEPSLLAPGAFEAHVLMLPATLKLTYMACWHHELIMRLVLGLLTPYLDFSAVM